MTPLAQALRPLVDSHTVPGLVAAVGRGDDIEVAVLGAQAVDGPPMAQDSLFRLASVTKPMLTALALTFVADGTLRLEQPVGDLLPELASPAVLRELTGPVDDTVPATRPIAIRDLLTSILEANLTQVSVRQNNDMRKISAWVAIAAVPTMLAGIWGMNFRHMPEIDEVWGYPLALGLMVLVCSALYRRFKKSGWL